MRVVSGVVERARRDLERGEPWLARDRLTSTLLHRPADPVLLDLLAATLAGMNDLPAAGAAWFLSARPDAEVAAALAALDRRHPRPHARAMALRARAPLSAYPPAARHRLTALRAELAAQGWHWEVGTRPRAPQGSRGGRRGAGRPPGDAPAPWRTADVLRAVGVAALVLANAAFYVFGLVTWLRWLRS